MKKKILLFLNVAIMVMLSFSIEAFAEDGESTGTEQEYFEQDKLISVINEILTIRQQNPEYTEEQIIIQMNERHSEFEKGRGVIDIWNALTDSEKKLCVRYPFDALKVNTAKNIATSQTETKFGFNGLGDKSDAFRHGIWNAEMTILIGLARKRQSCLLQRMRIKMLQDMNLTDILKQLTGIWTYIIMNWGGI